MLMRPRSALVLAAIAAAAFSAVPAGAQDGKPAPCTKMHATDPPGDQRYGFAGNFSPIPAANNVDLKGLFLNSAAGKVTMNIQLTEVSKTVPPEANSIVYRVLYSEPPELFLDIEIEKNGTVTYTYGHFAPAPTGDGETKGSLFEGPDGVISVNLPPSHGGKAGMKVAGNMFSSYATPAVLASTDFMPDEGDFSYNGEQCPSSGGGGGGETPPPPPSGGGTPPPGGGPTPPPGGPQTQRLGKLAVTVSPRKFKVKKVKRSLTFKLKSSEEISNLTAKFTKGSKTVGTGSLARVSGTAKLKLKLKGKRRLRKGSYQLVLNGRKADGSNGTAIFKIRGR